ncbi:MAG TPA: type II secretion system protein GspL [Burkholderiaceae bacterium]
MSTLYIRHPARASVDTATGEALGELAQPALGTAPASRFAQVSDGGTVMQQGAALLGNMADTIALASRVVLLLAASDVSLLRVKAPPLSGARLKAALPNLVEEQLISDPAECVVVPATSTAVALESPDSLLRVAVVQRAWLELLVQALMTQGARQISVLPAQLCLPAPDANAVHAAVGEITAAGDVELTVRLGQYDGIGLAVPAGVTEPDAGADQVLATLQALAGPSALQVHVPQAQVASYQRAADMRNAALAGSGATIAVAADQWTHWIAAARLQTLDLMSGLNLRTGAADWRRWRWPLGLAAAIALINIAALNVEWWRLKRQADVQQALLVQTYKTAYPREPVVYDPVAQMAQKIAAAKLNSGTPAADDFLALASNFNQAWTATTAGRGGIAQIAAVEYRERGMTVKFKNDGTAPFDELRGALAARNIALTQPTPGTWQLRSGK